MILFEMTIMTSSWRKIRSMGSRRRRRSLSKSSSKEEEKKET